MMLHNSFQHRDLIVAQMQSPRSLRRHLSPCIFVIVKMYAAVFVSALRRSFTHIVE